MTRLESLIEQLKNGSETDKAANLLELLMSDPTSDFIADGYKGNSDLSSKGGVFHLHDKEYKHHITITRLYKRSYYTWNVRLLKGPASWLEEPTDIVIKLDRQDATFIKGFIMFSSMEA